MITLNIKLNFTEQEYLDLLEEFGRQFKTPSTKENVEQFLSELVQALFSVRKS